MLLKRKSSKGKYTTNVGKCSKLFTVRSWATQHYLKVLCSNFSYENYNFYNFFGKFCCTIVAKCSKPFTSFCQTLLGIQHFLTQIEAILITYFATIPKNLVNFVSPTQQSVVKYAFIFKCILAFFAWKLACDSNSTTNLVEDQVFFISF